MTKTIEMATAEGYWLAAEGNRGWYTCERTGKKFRGEQAKKIFAEMDELLEAQEEAQEAQETPQETEAPEDTTEAKEDTKETAGDIQGQQLEVTEADQLYAGDFGNTDEETPETMTQRLQLHIAGKQLDGQAKGIKLVRINCVDCNDERVIKVQDAHQVKRCVSCQKKHKNRRRTEKRREKRAAAREAQLNE